MNDTREHVLEQGCTTHISWRAKKFFFSSKLGEYKIFWALRANSKASAGHIWPAGHVLCTPVLEEKKARSGFGIPEKLFLKSVFFFSSSEKNLFLLKFAKSKIPPQRQFGNSGTVEHENEHFPSFFLPKKSPAIIIRAFP